MKKILSVCALVAVLGYAFSVVAKAEGLKPEDFRPAIPSRARLSYDWSLSRYPGQRMHLFWDKKLGYHLYSYVITRELIKDQIQTIIDYQQLTDRAKIEQVINHFLDITPQEREVLVVVYFHAPGISNRYFVNEFSNFEDFVFLEYGSKKLQTHVERVRKQMQKERREYPTKEELIYEGGARPFFVDIKADYLYYPEKTTVVDQAWDPLTNSYRWVFSFKFNDEDLARIEELVLNEIPVSFNLVVSDPHLFAYKPLPKLQQYQILKMVNPEFVEFMEAIEEMSPAKEHVKVSERRYWPKG